jgi:hypothetical protein
MLPRWCQHGPEQDEDRGWAGGGRKGQLLASRELPPETLVRSLSVGACRLLEVPVCPAFESLPRNAGGLFPTGGAAGASKDPRLELPWFPSRPSEE